MLNSNIKNISKFEFLNSIKSKGYLILNIILCVLIVLLINFQTVVSMFKSVGILNNQKYVIEIWDEEGIAFEYFENNVGNNNIENVVRKNEKVYYEYDLIKSNVIGINVVESIGYSNVEIISKDTISSDMYDFIQASFNKLKNNQIENKYEITIEDIEIYNTKVTLNDNILSKAIFANDSTKIISTFVGYIMFMLVMTISMTVASNIANEKTSKNAEYIFSNIPAKDYLNGKILAANFRTILSIVLIIFYALLGLIINQIINANSLTDTGVTLDLANANVKTLAIYSIVTLFEIILTTTFVSYIEAYIASKIKSVSELDSAITLPTMLLAVCYIASNMVFDAGNIFLTLSMYVPVISMFVLPTAIMLNKINMFNIVLSILVNILFIYFAYDFVGKRFKNNILDLNSKKKENLFKEEDNLQNEIERLKLKERNKIIENKLKLFISCTAICLILVNVLGNVLGFIPYFFANENVKLICNICVFVIYLGIPALVLSALIKPSKRENGVVSSKNKKDMLFMGIFLIAVVQVINSIIASIFNITTNEVLETYTALPATFLGIVLFILEIAVAPAIFEELLFRKVILDRAKEFGVAFAIIFTSVLFGVFHQNLAQLFGTMGIGFVLGYVVLKTKDIKLSMILHFINNFMAVLIEIIFADVNFAAKNLSVIILTVIVISMLYGCFIFIKYIVAGKIKLGLRRKRKIKRKSIDDVTGNAIILNNKDEILNISGVLKNICTSYYMVVLLVTIFATIIMYGK